LENLLVLLSNREEDQIFASSVCQVAKTNLVNSLTPDEAIHLLIENPSTSALINASDEELSTGFHLSVANILGPSPNEGLANRVHFLSDLPISRSGSLVHSPILGSLVRRDPKTPQDSGTYYGRIIQAALRCSPFGISDFFKHSGRIQTIEVTALSQKNGVLETIKAYLASNHWASRQQTTVLTALDELLINAAYDAPQAALGPQSQGTQKLTRFSQFGPGTHIQVKFIFDGIFFGASVTDFYGSLNKKKLMEHIPKDHTTSIYTPKPDTLTGGIGLSMVYQTGGGLTFICQPGIKTESIVTFKKAEHSKDFRRQFQFVSTHFYKTPSQEILPRPS
jgi:hypothetical protein